MKIKEAFKMLIKEGKSEEASALICIGAITNGLFDLTEEPKRTETIKSFIKDNS